MTVHARLAKPSMSTTRAAAALPRRSVAPAAQASRAIGAMAFTTGDHVAFAGAPSLHTAAHEAAHVVQQAGGVRLAGGVGGTGDRHERHADAVADRVVAGQSVEALLAEYQAPPASTAESAVQAKCTCGTGSTTPCTACADGQAGAAKASCKQGCAQRWGQDTTCSKWGFRAGEAEHAPQFVAKADPPKHAKAVKDLLSPCCNTWPFAVEDHARRHLGLNGAASCPAQHEREVATVGFGGKQVQVLCSDTIPGGMVGTTADPRHCNGKLSAELLEMSPKAMQDLSGQIGSALHVDVCFSGTKQDMCGHDGPGKASFPEATDCVTRGCATDPDRPKLKDTGWPRI